MNPQYYYYSSNHSFHCKLDSITHWILLQTGFYYKLDSHQTISANSLTLFRILNIHDSYFTFILRTVLELIMNNSFFDWMYNDLKNCDIKYQYQH